MDPEELRRGDLPEEERAKSVARKRENRADLLLAVGCLPVPVFICLAILMIATQGDSAIVTIILFWLTMAGAGGALVLGVRDAIRFRHDRGDSRRAWGVAFVTFLGLAASGCMAWMATHLGHGRALRRGGVARVPDTRRTSGWRMAVPFRPLTGTPRSAAGAWRTNAAAETASVAAFAHLANDLLAMGAPATLVERAHESAMEEIRHARLCYEIATAIDGEIAGPAPFPAALLPRDESLTLARLATECLVESCIIESASARVAARLAEQVGLAEQLRSILRELAADEARHARFGYDIVEWCYRKCPSIDADVRRALASVDHGKLLQGLPDDDLEAHGIAGRGLWYACLKEATSDAEAWVQAQRVAA